MISNKSQIPDIIPIAGQKIALAFLGGLVLWFIPTLHNWIIYFIWGPLLGMTFVWAYWKVRMRTDDGFNWIKNPVRAFIIGVIHVIAVTCVWFAVTKFAN